MRAGGRRCPRLHVAETMAASKPASREMSTYARATAGLCWARESSTTPTSSVRRRGLRAARRWRDLGRGRVSTGAVVAGRDGRSRLGLRRDVAGDVLVAGAAGVGAVDAWKSRCRSGRSAAGGARPRATASPAAAATATAAASRAFFTRSEATLARQWPNTARRAAESGSRRSPASTSSATSAARCSTSARRSRCGRACAATSRPSAGLARDDRAAPGAGRRRRGDRHRHRGRGAPPRAEPGQAAPAAVQRPPARRQVVPVHRGHRRGRLPARDVHARAAPARRRLLRPVREREEGARDARRAQPRLPVPALRGAEAGPALAGSRASTTTSSAAWRRAWATSRRRTTARSSTA